MHGLKLHIGHLRNRSESYITCLWIDTSTQRVDDIHITKLWAYNNAIYLTVSRNRPSSHTRNVAKIAESLQNDFRENKWSCMENNSLINHNKHCWDCKYLSSKSFIHIMEKFNTSSPTFFTRFKHSGFFTVNALLCYLPYFFATETIHVTHSIVKLDP